MIGKLRIAPIKENLPSIPKLELKQGYCKNKNQDNGGAQRSSYQYIPLVRLENCTELFGQRPLKFSSILSHEN